MLQFGNIQYSQNEKGQWLYKSLPLKFAPFKKAKYQERPRYRVILEWEKELQSDFNKILLKTSVEQIAKLLMK